MNKIEKNTLKFVYMGIYFIFVHIRRDRRKK